MLANLVKSVNENPRLFNLNLDFEATLSEVRPFNDAEVNRFGPEAHALRLKLPRSVCREGFCSTMKKALKHLGADESVFCTRKRNAQHLH